MSETQPLDLEPYDPACIFHANGPICPTFMTEAIRSLMRALPLDGREPALWRNRRMYAALRSLAALCPRDEIEVMMAVQAISAHAAASSCWHLGMNIKRPPGDPAHARMIAAAISSARAFETMVKGLERRQAKPLSAPPGLPEPRQWKTPNVSAIMYAMEDRCRDAVPPPDPERPAGDVEEAALDPTGIEGVQANGSIVVPDDPSQGQQVYIGMRLARMYRREMRDKGGKQPPALRPLRTGDIVP